MLFQTRNSSAQLTLITSAYITRGLMVGWNIHLCIQSLQYPMSNYNIRRSAKSGSDWSEQEMLAYRITIDHLTPLQFFGHDPNTKPYPFSEHLLSTENPTIAHDISDEEYEFLAFLQQALEPDVLEPAIDEFGRQLLKAGGFQERGTLLRTRVAIPITICGDSTRLAQTDVCLVGIDTGVLLIVQTRQSSQDPVAQLMAAIATYQANNKLRASRSLSPLLTMNIPCITMSGTQSEFYIVPVTQQLSQAVITAQCPRAETVAMHCTLPPPPKGSMPGLRDPEYRRTVLKYYSSFRSLAKRNWTPMLDGLFRTQHT